MDRSGNVITRELLEQFDLETLMVISGIVDAMLKTQKAENKAQGKA